MKSVFISILLILSYYSHSQRDYNWNNLIQENQAEIALEKGNYNLAIQLYEKALEIRKSIYPKGFILDINSLQEISNAMSNLIGVYSEAGRYNTHIEMCNELSSWTKQGIDSFPNETSPYLEYGMTQIQIAESYQVLKQYDKGISICDKIIIYFKERDNYIVTRSVSETIIPYAHARWGEILKEKGDTLASAKQHQKSVTQWQKQLNRVNNKLIHKEIAKQSEICVQRFGKLGDSTNVIKYAKISANHNEILIDQYSDNRENTLNSARNTLGDYLTSQGSHEEAAMYYKQSLILNEELYKRTKENQYLLQSAAISLKLSRCYESLNDKVNATKYLSQRINTLIQLDDAHNSKDYSYTLSRNEYNLAAKYLDLKNYDEAESAIDASIITGKTALEKDPENTRKQEWPWIQEFLRYKILKEKQDYTLAHSSLDRLFKIFTVLEEKEGGIQYSEHLKEVETSQAELSYPDVVQLDVDIENEKDEKIQFEKKVQLVKLLKKKSKKDNSIVMSYVKNTSDMAWSGFMIGEYKKPKRALKKAIRLKTGDPYLISNYAPSLLFLGKYKKAIKVYKENFDKPFKPGERLIDAFMDDFKEFEKEEIIPKKHIDKVNELKTKLMTWDKDK